MFESIWNKADIYRFAGDVLESEIERIAHVIEAKMLLTLAQHGIDPNSLNEVKARVEMKDHYDGDPYIGFWIDGKKVWDWTIIPCEHSDKEIVVQFCDEDIAIQRTG